MKPASLSMKSLETDTISSLFSTRAIWNDATVIIHGGQLPIDCSLLQAVTPKYSAALNILKQLHTETLRTLVCPHLHPLSQLHRPPFPEMPSLNVLKTHIHDVTLCACV